MNDGLSHRVIRAAASWPFISSVSLLLVNDLYLKAAYSNWLTGKLSDLSGIFFVSLILFSAFPRMVWNIAVLIAAGFALWKSPLSQPLFDLVHMSGIACIGRVVDYSDLIALFCMPVAYYVASHIDRYQFTGPTLSRAGSAPILAVAFLATLGTSVMPHTGRYTIRRADHSVEPIDGILAAKIIANIAGKHGLRCIAQCEHVVATAQYGGGGTYMRYVIHNQRNIAFSVEATDKSVMRALMQDLKAVLGTRFDDMEFVVPLPEPSR